MLPSPSDVKTEARLGDYARAWGDIMQRVRAGYSWSGHERNCAFLNEGRSGRFANVSAVSGFDFPDDGRAMALTDWDRDGDIDVWLRNRTAPRLRLLLNHCQDGAWVALRLRGTVSNRDGVGAVAMVKAEGASQRKSVRAGDLFLSQSSKWLHFGLGSARSVASVLVRWPGGEEEQFDGVEVGGRYLLVEGTGEARRQAQMEREIVPVDQDAVATSTARPLGSARIVLPARVPLPVLRYRDKAAKPSVLQRNGKARLLLLWSGKCAHCEKTLGALARKPPGIELLALAVDGLEEGGFGEVYTLMDRLKPPFAWGVLAQESVAVVGELQAFLFDGQPELAVPMAMLIDGHGNALAIYRGFQDTAVFDADAARLPRATPFELHHLAPPLRGTWFTNPVDQRWYAGSIRRALAEGK